MDRMLAAFDRDTMRRVLPIAAGAVGVMLVWWLVRRTAADKLADRMEDAVNSLPLNPNEMTIAPPTARYIAEKLFMAMNQNGTDESAILNGFAGLKTTADLVAVIKAFGVRMYGWTSGNESWIGKVTGWASPLDLGGWLRQELSGKTLMKIEGIYRRLGLQL